jgi:V/A-type H+/Na+-transporting ATPase subunit I
MIVKMQKLTLLVRGADREAALRALGRLGIVHPQAVRAPAAGDIDRLESERARIDKALQVIGGREGREADAGAAAVSDRVRQILDRDRRQEALQRELDELQDQRRWFEEWGQASWASVQALRRAGLVARFYVADRSILDRLPADRFIRAVKEDRKTVHLVQLAGSPEARLDLREDPMPQVEFEVLASRLARLGAESAAIDRELDGLAGCRSSLLACRAELEKRLEFDRVKHGMGEESGLAWLQGFVPADSVPLIRAAAGREGWAYLVQEPAEEDEVPTLIRTPRWLRPIEPVFRLMGTIPGYRERDISFWFLVFFSLFFAMIIGDAAYGLIFLLLNLYISRKYRDLPREPFYLVYVLSGATLVWGAVTGVWFGYEGFARLPVLRSLVVERLYSFGTGNQDLVLSLCFLIGVVQLTVARAWNLLRCLNSLKALAEAGWIAVLGSMYFVARWIILGKPLPGAVVPCLGAGVGLVLLFANPRRNLLKGMLLTLSDLPLKVVGCFSDIVSYLRLFAIGTASLVMSTTFNGMAAEIGAGSAPGKILVPFLLVAGHLINASLGLMAVLVHGIRLNMLEFSGHLNMEWSGKSYRPFKA